MNTKNFWSVILDLNRHFNLDAIILKHLKFPEFSNFLVKFDTL